MRIGSPQSVPGSLDEKNWEGSSMKSVTAAALVILGCLVHEAKAQQAAKLPAVDFSTMTCEQFWEKTTAADRGPFLFWLSGYFSHKKNSAVLDPADFTDKTKALSQTCSKQPNDSVLSVAEKAFAN
jgi:HdeA/HdeB family